MAYRRYYRNRSFKKKSIISKIENLSYSALLKWEIAYKNKIKEIEDILNLNEFRKKNKELEKIQMSLPNVSHLTDEIEKYQSYLTITREYFILKKFWSADQGIIIGNLKCINDSKMNKILNLIIQVQKKWSILVPYDAYFRNFDYQINKFRKDLEIEKDISTYVAYDHQPYGGISGEILNYFYKKTISNGHGGYESITGSFTNMTNKPMTIKDYTSEDYIPCSSKDLKHLNKLSSLYLVGNFFKKLHQLNIGYIPFPKGPPESLLIKYRNFFLEKANHHLRKIQLKIRSKKRSVDLSTNENFVYVMSNESLPKKTYKIGWTSILPEERAEELTSTGVLYDFKVEYQKKFKDAEKVESVIHKHFKKYRVKKNKEFFEVELNEIIEFIKSLD